MLTVRQSSRIPHIAAIAPVAIAVGYLINEGVIVQLGLFSLIGLWISCPVNLFRLGDRLGIKLRNNVKALGLILGAAWITLYAPSSFAQVGPPAPGGGAGAVNSCGTGTGMFARLAQFFSAALSSAGQGGAANDVCLIMRLLEGMVALLFIGALVYAVNEVRQGAEVKSAFMPIGLVLLTVVASGIIIRLTMGA